MEIFSVGNTLPWYEFSLLALIIIAEVSGCLTVFSIIRSSVRRWQRDPWIFAKRSAARKRLN